MVGTLALGWGGCGVTDRENQKIDCRGQCSALTADRCVAVLYSHKTGAKTTAAELEKKRCKRRSIAADCRRRTKMSDCEEKKFDRCSPSEESTSAEAVGGA